MAKKNKQVNNPQVKAAQPQNLVAQQKKMQAKSMPAPPTTFAQGMQSIVPKGSFARLGAAGGGLFGPIGGKVGAFLGGKIANIAGFGAYKVSQNSLVARVDEGVDLPQFHSSEHATVVRHREFIRDIPASGGAAFTVYSFPLNPGLAASFPYLANLAVNFESYQILGMIFEYRSTSADITAGGALGSVVLATDYNPVAPTYTSKLVMENSEYSMSVKPSMGVVHAVECDPSISFSPVKFVRNTTVPSGSDSRLYDWGNFQVATVGLPTSTGNLGELWVSYEVALYKPSLDLNIFGSLSDHFQLPATLTTSGYLSPGVVLNPTSGSSLKGSAFNSTYSFPSSIYSGTYMVNYTVFGSGTSAQGTYMSVTVAGGNRPNAYYGGTTSIMQMESVQNNQWGCLFTVTVTSTNCTLTFINGNLPVGPIGGDLYIIQVPSAL